MQLNPQQNDSPPVDNTSQSTSANVTQNRPSTVRPKKIVEINSADQLSFENFLYTDMNKFSAKVVSITSKLIGPTVN
jgi:hypothetical protein